MVTGSALAASPQLSHLRFESFDALRRYSDLQFAVQPKAQELSFPDPPRPAFGFVHLQSQMLLNPVLNRGRRRFRRRFAAHVYIAVVRVPAVRVPSLIQFFIER